jgi:SIR2-like protein
VARILLIGAGFSRNWGGWLSDEVTDYLLTCKEVRNDTNIRGALARFRGDGGFESALSALQADFLRRGATRSEQVNGFQAAILRMFADLDRAFSQTDFEFQNEIPYLVRTFLAKFDAIFGLNQDYLLERHYLNANVQLSNPTKWNGWQIPGTRVIVDPYRDPLDTTPLRRTPDPTAFRLENKLQPYFKLHGSYNWETDAGQKLLLMGADKTSSIQDHGLLRWSFETFKGHFAGPTRLMIIGYGFRDEHINRALIDAATAGRLELFVIDRLGVGALDQNNKTRGGSIYVRSELDEILSPTLIGASQRSLREIFGTDRAEHMKVETFFK